MRLRLTSGRIVGFDAKYFLICFSSMPCCTNSRSLVRTSLSTISSICCKAYESVANFFFRRPDIFDTLIAQSGLYHASYFFGNYSDELVYSNSPEDYLTWMPRDHYYWDEYRKRRIIVCCGQGNWEEDLLASTRRLDTILRDHGVPAWFDYWGFDVAHDWCWWRPQIRYFMGKVLG